MGNVKGRTIVSNRDSKLLLVQWRIQEGRAYGLDFLICFLFYFLFTDTCIFCISMIAYYSTNWLTHYFIRNTLAFCLMININCFRNLESQEGREGRERSYHLPPWSAVSLINLNDVKVCNEMSNYNFMLFWSSSDGVGKQVFFHCSWNRDELGKSAG